ncbi:MAG: toll/interleukin-1 receptor domain-containing protein [bacterium]|nr:toll/interleukin-1 receptor domain-containing protein [bacterium]
MPRLFRRLGGMLPVLLLVIAIAAPLRAQDAAVTGTMITDVIYADSDDGQRIEIDFLTVDNDGLPTTTPINDIRLESGSTVLSGDLLSEPSILYVYLLIEGSTTMASYVDTLVPALTTFMADAPENVRFGVSVYTTSILTTIDPPGSADSGESYIAFVEGYFEGMIENAADLSETCTLDALDQLVERLKGSSNQREMILLVSDGAQPPGCGTLPETVIEHALAWPNPVPISVFGITSAATLPESYQVYDIAGTTGGYTTGYPPEAAADAFQAHTNALALRKTAVFTACLPAGETGDFTFWIENPAGEQFGRSIDSIPLAVGCAAAVEEVVVTEPAAIPMTGQINDLAYDPVNQFLTFNVTTQGDVTRLRVRFFDAETGSQIGEDMETAMFDRADYSIDATQFEGIPDLLIRAILENAAGEEVLIEEVFRFPTTPFSQSFFQAGFDAAINRVVIDYILRGDRIVSRVRLIDDETDQVLGDDLASISPLSGNFLIDPADYPGVERMRVQLLAGQSIETLSLISEEVVELPTAQSSSASPLEAALPFIVGFAALFLVLVLFFWLRPGSSKTAKGQGVRARVDPPVIPFADPAQVTNTMPAVRVKPDPAPVPPAPITVFISYRRTASAILATFIARELAANQIDAFVDTRKTDAGQFPERFLREIEARDVLIVLLGANTLDSEWVQREIAHAHTLGKIMIPVFQEAYQPPATITPATAALLQYQGVHIFDVKNLYVDEALRDLIHLIRASRD